MRSTDAHSPPAIRGSYRKRRRWRNAIGLGGAVYATAILWIPGLSHPWMARLGLIGAAVFGALTWVIWRCPACKARLGTSWRDKECPMCGIKLVEDRGDRTMQGSGDP